MSWLLGRVRKVVTFFHCSTTAAAVLKDKQEMLYLPPHKLIQDVPTRWNRCIKRSIKDIVTLSDDVKLSEDIIQVLKPLKMVTTLLSTEQLPTVSMIMPLKHTILESMKVSDTVISDLSFL